jgi:hypothetical protein
MKKPLPPSGEWMEIDKEAEKSFVENHTGFRVFSVSFDPPAWTVTENKEIGATYRNCEAWIGAKGDQGCFVFRAAFRATKSPGGAFTPVHWYADRSREPVHCGDPWGEGSPPPRDGP